MSVLTKQSPSSFRSVSGPASRVVSQLKAGRNAHVLAIELTPEKVHLEPSLRKALDILASVLDKDTDRLLEERMRRLGEFLIEGIELPQTAVTEAKMRAAVIRHLITKGSWLTAADIARQGKYSQSNPAEPANRWKREGKVFAVNFKDQDLFAAYQFDESMKPRGVVAEVLRLFKNKRDPWKIAGWFASVNGWLRGKRPQDCLDDPERVIESARQEIAGFEA